MKEVPGSPMQKKTIDLINKRRKKLGMKEEVELDEAQEQGFLVKIPGIGELIIKAKNKAEIRKMLIKKFKKIDDFDIGSKRMLEPQIKMWHRKKGGMAPDDDEDNNEE